MQGKRKENERREWGRFRFVCVFLLAGILVFAGWNEARAAKLRDLASVKGVRSNQLVGYGLVVGLDGTGDGTRATFTSQSLVNMMQNLGIPLTRDEVNVKNVASVMITAKLPPFAKIGQSIDVVLSSLGDATSLAGGTLLPTQLKGLDNRVYAIAQGPVSIGGLPVTNQTANTQRNYPTVARIPGGASVEREVRVNFADKHQISLSLKQPDFTTVERVVKSVDKAMDGAYATAVDGSTVRVTVPKRYAGKQIALLARLENLDVTPETPARVVLDERTGTVVMGGDVRIGSIALSHGNLSLQISGPPQPKTGQPSGRVGDTVVRLPAGASLGEVVRALNSMGVSPRDMIAIFQSIKAAGALQAKLEVI